MSVLNSTHDGIILVDSIGAIVFANEAATSMFGYADNEMVGMTVDALVPEDFRSNHAGLRKAFMDSPAKRFMNQKRSFKAQKKDGSQFSACISLNPCVLDGEKHVCVSIQDLTQIEEENIRLEQSQKLEALGEMVAGIAHNFNNAIAGIQGQSYLLAKKESLTSEAHARLETINSLCQQSSDIIKQLMVYARQSQDSMAEFDVAEAIREVAEISKVACPENITIKIEGMSEGQFVFGEKSQIQQTVLNLINNACDAIGDNEGKITLSVKACRGETCKIKQCQLKQKKSGMYVCIKVHDSAGKIKADIIHRIFDPFFTTKPIGKGTGLGLSTSYGIVRKHGSELSVSSSKKKGTLFQFYLPAMKSNMEKPAVSHTPKSTPNCAGLLIVDDDSTINEMLNEIFTDLGYKVFVASDGSEALSIFTSHTNEIDLILTDVAMPTMGGYALYDAVREVNSDVPFLFLSGYLDVSNRIAELEDSMVIMKPFDVIDLTERVFAEINKSRNN